MSNKRLSTVWLVQLGVLPAETPEEPEEEPEEDPADGEDGEEEEEEEDDDDDEEEDSVRSLPPDVVWAMVLFRNVRWNVV